MGRRQNDLGSELEIVYGINEHNAAYKTDSYTEGDVGVKTSFVEFNRPVNNRPVNLSDEELKELAREERLRFRFNYFRKTLGLPDPSESTLRVGDIFMQLEVKAFESYRIVDVTPDHFTCTDDSFKRYDLPYEHSKGVFLRISKKGIPKTIAVSARYLEEML